jgi:guanylate kinase
LEWTSFLGNYYGTPVPESTDGRDVVLEIEVDGARQVKALHPEAVLIFVLPPSREEQQRRLRGRGDPEDKVDQRLQKALDEEPVGLAIANHVVVNDDLGRTVDEMMQIIQHHRLAD